MQTETHEQVSFTDYGRNTTKTSLLHKMKTV